MSSFIIAGTTENEHNFCGIYADSIAAENEANGGNYYEGWFYAYKYCDAVVYQ